MQTRLYVTIICLLGSKYSVVMPNEDDLIWRQIMQILAHDSPVSPNSLQCDSPIKLFTTCFTANLRGMQISGIIITKLVMSYKGDTTTTTTIKYL